MPEMRIQRSQNEEEGDEGQEMMRVGILALQGDVSEHVEAVYRALSDMGKDGEVVEVRKKEDADNLYALIIPGGESTTISRLLDSTRLREKILSEVGKGMRVMGTCAGAIMLAKVVDDPRVKPLGLISMKARRNAFGRQKDSFETYLNVKGLDEPYHAVFIRAPIIEEVFGEAEILAEFNGNIVMVREGPHFAMSFHPELTEDTRIHRMFLK